jgi:hypothetical protein
MSPSIFKKARNVSIYEYDWGQLLVNPTRWLMAVMLGRADVPAFARHFALASWSDGDPDLLAGDQ